MSCSFSSPEQLSSCRCSSCIHTCDDAQPRPSFCRSGSPMTATFSSQLHYRLIRTVSLQLKEDPKPKGTVCHSMAIPQVRHFFFLPWLWWAEGQGRFSTQVPHQNTSSSTGTQPSCPLGEQQVSSHNPSFSEKYISNFLFQFLSAAAAVRLYLLKGTNHQNCNWHKRHSTKWSSVYI